MRHAFEADHISAIDDTTRHLRQKGKRPLGVGLAFSLGRSPVVFGVAFAAQAANGRLPERHSPIPADVGIGDERRPQLGDRVSIQLAEQP